MPSRYSIKDLERISGIKAHTLRIWEQRYGILKPERTTTNIRYYGNADIRRILNISLLNTHGYKISRIAKLSDAELIHEVEKHVESFTHERDQSDDLVLSLMDMNEERFEKTINSSITHFGFEKTMENIVFPFLRHLGNLWQVGIVSAAQEHYISNLIRQKLIVGIDSIKAVPRPEAPSYLFFLPNSELHELGLLYLYYLSRLKGHKCIYLGQSVPLEDLIIISEKVRPDHLVSIFTAGMNDDDIHSFLKSCYEKIPDATFLLSGRLFLMADTVPALPGKNFRIFEDFEAFKKWI